MAYNGFFGYSIIIDLVLILLLFLLIFVNVITFICVLIRKKLGKKFYVYTGINMFVSFLIFVLTLPSLLFCIGDIYNMKNNIISSIKYTEYAAKVATRNSYKSEAYMLISMQYRFLKDYENAIEYCKTSSKYHENSETNEDFYCEPYDLQNLYVKSQKYDKAIATIENNYEYFDKKFKSFKFYLLTKAYCLSGDYQNALKSINSYIGADKNSAGSDYAIRGYIYTKLNQPTLAQRDFNKAREEMNKWCQKINYKNPENKQKRLKSYMNGEFLKDVLP